MPSKLPIVKKHLKFLAASNYYGRGIEANPLLAHCRVRNGQVAVISSNVHCREDFIGYVRDHYILKKNQADNPFLMSNMGSSFEFLLTNNVGRNKNGRPKPIEAVLASKIGIYVRTKQAVKVMNTIENNFGWPLTTFKEVDTAGHIDMSTFYIKASKRWKRSPHLMSLYLLIIREARRFDMKPFTLMSEAIRQFNPAHDIRIYFKQWTTLLEMYHQIHRGFSHKKLFSEKILTESRNPRHKKVMDTLERASRSAYSLRRKISVHLFNEGIKLLCNKGTNYEIVGQRLESYVKIREKKIGNKKAKRPEVAVSYAK